MKQANNNHLRSIEAAPLTARVAELEGALNHLLTVKEYKDKNGKDEWYEHEQPIAWERANRAARTQNERSSKT